VVSVAGLARRPAQLVRRVGDAGTPDVYNDDPGVWESVGVYAFASQRRASEQTDDAGQVAVEDHVVVWDLDVPAAASDRVDIAGLGVFELTGPSHRVLRPQTGAYHHTEALGRQVT
jgi:hypothetical protein